MKPLVHPSLQDITVEGILHALSDPVRAAIFADIAASGCPRNCSNFLNIRQRAIPKSTLSQHFKALREAGLIRAERRGVAMENTSRCTEINQRFPGLLLAILKAHQVQQQALMPATLKTKGGGRKTDRAARHGMGMPARLARGRLGG